MNLSPEIMKQLLDTFKGELDEQIQLITDGLLHLEKDLEPSMRTDTFNTMFRAAHNVKGAARGIGLTALADVAHILESLFDKFRNSNEKFAMDTVDLALTSLDFMREAVEAADENKELLASRAAELCQLLQDRIAAKKKSEVVDQSAEILPELTTQSVGQFAGNAAMPETDVKPFTADQETPGQATHVKRSEDIKPQTIQVPVTKLDQLGAQMEQLLIIKSVIQDHFLQLADLRTHIDQISELWSEGTHIRKHRNGAIPGEVSQLFTDGIRNIKQIQSETLQFYRTMRKIANELGGVTDALQHNMRLLRLVPGSTILRPLTRSVRDIARELKKQVNFEVKGDDIGIDRSILDGLRDPLVHILRNAIDHGIEPPESRLRKGKPEQGHIALTVSREGSEVTITVSDDGAGIDLAKVRDSAINKNILSESETKDMNDAELLDIIFRPGFSSKAIVTNISGRGVGLDVVRANLRALKGTVSVETAGGKGSTFTLRVPLTLATDRGLLVTVGDKKFAVPSIAVDRILTITANKVVDVEASQAIIVDEKAVPLRNLAEILGIRSIEPLDNDQYQIVIISTGWRSVALLVDQILNERDIVVKPLPAPLHEVPAVAGASLLGSQGLVIVLNPADLIDISLEGKMHERINVKTPAGMQTKEAQILVVDDSITTRTLVRNILANQGYVITTAVDGKEAWEKLQTSEFDLVVTDVEMPIINGFELTKQIKQSEKYKQLPVIIVTSMAREEDKERGIEVGADAYIVKGDFETRVLLDVVGQFV